MRPTAAIWVKLAMEETLLEMAQSPIWLAYILDEAQGRNNKWEYISNPSLGFKVTVFKPIRVRFLTWTSRHPPSV